MKKLSLNSLAKLLILSILILGLITLKVFTKPSSESTIISQQKGNIVIHDQINSSELGAAFTLKDKHNNLFSSENLKGEYSLVYFGFARCPDICPAILRKLDDAVTILKQQGMEKVKIVFITLDPERDSPQVLTDYLSNFDNNIIGLTGSNDEIQNVAQSFRVFHAKIATEIYMKAAGISSAKAIDDNDYLVNHTSLIYLMDPSFNYLTSFHFETTSEEIVQYLLNITH